MRHIERNSILLFVVPADSTDIKAEYTTLLNELHEFNPELVDKQRLLAISKLDLIDETERAALKKRLPKGVKAVFISAVQQAGLMELKDAIWQLLTQTKVESE